MSKTSDSVEVRRRGKTVAEQTESQEPVHRKPGQAAVKVSIGQTINLGNFESLRLDVGIELPCDRTPDKIGSMHEVAVSHCMARLVELRKQVEEELLG